MCYYSLYLFLACGHCVPSYRRLGRSPPCPAQRRALLFHEPSLASPIGRPPGGSAPWTGAPYRPRETTVWDRDGDADGDVEEEAAGVECVEKMSHPLHTYRIAGLCLRCERERDQRLARFEVGSIRDGVEREGEGLLHGVSRRRTNRKNTHGMERLKVKVASPGLRSGYVEGRARRGMILERTAEGELVDRSREAEVGGGVEAEVEVEGRVTGVAEVMGWNPGLGVLEGRERGSWRRLGESSTTDWA